MTDNQNRNAPVPPQLNADPSNGATLPSGSAGQTSAPVRDMSTGDLNSERSSISELLRDAAGWDTYNRLGAGMSPSAPGDYSISAIKSVTDWIAPKDGSISEGVKSAGKSMVGVPLIFFGELYGRLADTVVGAKQTLEDILGREPPGSRLTPEGVEALENRAKQIDDELARREGSGAATEAPPGVTGPGHDGHDHTPDDPNLTDPEGHDVHEPHNPQPSPGQPSTAMNADPGVTGSGQPSTAMNADPGVTGPGHDGHDHTPDDPNLTDPEGHDVHEPHNPQPSPGQPSTAMNADNAHASGEDPITDVDPKSLQ